MLLEKSHLSPLALLVVQADHHLDVSPLLPAPNLTAGVVQEHVWRDGTDRKSDLCHIYTQYVCCWENMVSFVLDYLVTLIGDQIGLFV